MADPVEVAIETALLERATAFAAAQSPALSIALPNVAFTPPQAGPGVRWLRASFLPVPSVETGISFNAHIQHSGLMQIDVFWTQGEGEMKAARLASAAITSFARGTVLTKDGFSVRIDKAPYRGSIRKDDPWVMIPVSIPYQCFARPA